MGHRSIHSSPIPSITDKGVEWTIYCTMSLYLTTMRGCTSIKSYSLYSLIAQVASILRCNDTHRIRRKNSPQRYRHHVYYSSYVLCSSAHCFLRVLTQTHHTFILHSPNCPSQQSWVTDCPCLLGEVDLNPHRFPSSRATWVYQLSRNGQWANRRESMVHNGEK